MAEEHTRCSLCRFARRINRLFAALCTILLPVFCLHADLIEMHNGDRYVGKVLSLTNDTLVLQSEILGKVSVPRSKVASIQLGTNLAARPVATTNGIAPTGTASTAAASTTTPLPANGSASAIISLSGPSFHTFTNALPDLSALNRPNANSSSIIQDVRQQLTAAGPAAVGRFDEMVSQLLSGKMSMNDLKAQAKSAADQLREFKREMGDDAGDSLDGYLAILDSFLQDGTPAATLPGAAARSTKPAADSTSGGQR
jgi:hypothetical protein